jgi:hypothetical protein
VREQAGFPHEEALDPEALARGKAHEQLDLVLGWQRKLHLALEAPELEEPEQVVRAVQESVVAVVFGEVEGAVEDLALLEEVVLQVPGNELM